MQRGIGVKFNLRDPLNLRQLRRGLPLGVAAAGQLQQNLLNIHDGR